MGRGSKCLLESLSWVCSLAKKILMFALGAGARLTFGPLSITSAASERSTRLPSASTSGGNGH